MSIRGFAFAMAALSFFKRCSPAGRAEAVAGGFEAGPIETAQPYDNPRGERLARDLR